MTLPFLFLLNVVLITRIVLYFGDGPISSWKFLFAAGIQLAATQLFTPNQAVCILQSVILFLNIFSWIIENVEKREQEAKGRFSILLKRLLVLCVYLVVISIFFAPRFNITFSASLETHFNKYQDYYLPAKILIQADWRKFHLHLLGTLLCINEVNLLIRYVIDKLKIKPLKKQKNVSLASIAETAAAAATASTVTGVATAGAAAAGAAAAVIASATTGGSVAVANAETELREYNRGRIIGLLERVMIFFFILQEQLTVLGFVISAKTIARFKELDDREFAEYFIIGTMLSLVSAGAVALLIKLCMG